MSCQSWRLFPKALDCACWGWSPAFAMTGPSASRRASRAIPRLQGVRSAREARRDTEEVVFILVFPFYYLSRRLVRTWISFGCYYLFNDRIGFIPAIELHARTASGLTYY